MTTPESMTKVRDVVPPIPTPGSALGPSMGDRILVVISGMPNIKGPKIKRT